MLSLVGFKAQPAISTKPITRIDSNHFATYAVEYYPSRITAAV